MVIHMEGSPEKWNKAHPIEVELEQCLACGYYAVIRGSCLKCKTNQKELIDRAKHSHTFPPE